MDFEKQAAEIYQERLPQRKRRVDSRSIENNRRINDANKKSQEDRFLEEAKLTYLPLIISKLREDGKKVAEYLDSNKSDGVFDIVKSKNDTVTRQTKLGSVILGGLNLFGNNRTSVVSSDVWILRRLPYRSRTSVSRCQDTVIATSESYVESGIGIDRQGDYVRYEIHGTKFDSGSESVNSRKARLASDDELIPIGQITLEGDGSVADLPYVKYWEKQLLSKI